MPSLDHKAAEATFDDLRHRLASLNYPGIEGNTTVSIGFCVLGPQCFLTNPEAEHRAERAKNFAKKKGRDRLATYTTDQFREEDLFVCKRKKSK
jgi:hypothetical protein